MEMFLIGMTVAAAVFGLLWAFTDTPKTVEPLPQQKPDNWKIELIYRRIIEIGLMVNALEKANKTADMEKVKKEEEGEKLTNAINRVLLSNEADLYAAAAAARQLNHQGCGKCKGCQKERS